VFGVCDIGRGCGYPCNSSTCETYGLRTIDSQSSEWWTWNVLVPLILIVHPLVQHSSVCLFSLEGDNAVQSVDVLVAMCGPAVINLKCMTGNRWATSEASATVRTLTPNT